MNRSLAFLCLVLATGGLAMYVDKGIPYNDGPLKVGELTVTVTMDRSPKHVKVYFPLEVGDYAVIYFIGGLSSIVPAEFYSIFLTKLASHGFYVFGIDYDFPVTEGRFGEKLGLGQDIEKYFQELEFLIKYMDNRTESVPRWDYVGLMCHSAGCDITLRMVELDRFPFISSAFLEPYSQAIRHSVNHTVPSLMYGTQLAEEGFPPCNIKGYDFEQFYSQWTCPRIALEVADFGHCDILDPIGWEGCHVTHFCKTTNDTRLTHYRQFVQGVAASFFISTLQGREGVIQYIIDTSKLILKCLVAKSDIVC